MYSSDLSDGGKSENSELPQLLPEDTDDNLGILPAGIYLAVITYVVIVTSKARVEAVLDIAAGPHRGFFGSCPPTMDWSHTLYMPYGQGKRRFTINALRAISEANEGFDAIGAWNAGADDLRARLVLVSVSHRESENLYGEAETLYSFHAILPSAARKGCIIPGTTHRDGTRDQGIQIGPIDVDALLSEAHGDTTESGAADDEDVNPLWGVGADE